jgi:catechol 2,3-dioxygenase-like lactoylglutathione lyase family enzyme
LEAQTAKRVKIERFSIVICQTSNMDRSVQFYRDILGLTPEHVTPYWSDFVIGDVRLGIHPPYKGSEPPFSIPNKGWTIGFHVDDVRALRAQLEAAGVPCEDYHDIPGGVQLEFRDPDGHTIHAAQMGISTKDLL